MAILKVLIVDDASFVRDMVKRTIRNGFPTLKAEEASDGKKALHLMKHNQYDLILCDWEMPEMTGIELLEWAREQESYKTVPFVLVTSRGDRGHVVEAVQKGASDYLGKPFSAEQLSNKIIKALGKKLKTKDKPNSGPLQDAFAQSASLLTGGVAAAKPKPKAPDALNQSASVLTGSTSTSIPTKSKPKGLAEVRFADCIIRCIIKDISLEEIWVVAKREQVFPGILETAVVDIEYEQGQFARLNGYIHLLQAVDKRMDTDFVVINIRFVDEDPEKKSQLTQFIEKSN
jgi:CheY-like chemotaxis protein